MHARRNLPQVQVGAFSGPRAQRGGPTAVRSPSSGAWAMGHRPAAFGGEDGHVTHVLTTLLHM